VRHNANGEQPVHNEQNDLDRYEIKEALGTFNISVPLIDTSQLTNNSNLSKTTKILSPVKKTPYVQLRNQREESKGST